MGRIRWSARSAYRRYGAPDVYYSDSAKEQQELALPKNIFLDKQDFTHFLNENYGRYELNDYVLSTHECMEEKTQADFVANVNRISVYAANENRAEDGTITINEDMRISPSTATPKQINECIESRFKETDVGLTDQDFSAFAKLHSEYLDLDQEIKCIDQDTRKVQGYAWYTHLPHNICNHSLNPKQLNDANIDDDLADLR